VSGGKNDRFLAYVLNECSLSQTFVMMLFHTKYPCVFGTRSNITKQEIVDVKRNFRLHPYVYKFIRQIQRKGQNPSFKVSKFESFTVFKSSKKLLDEIVVTKALLIIKYKLCFTLLPHLFLIIFILVIFQGVNNEAKQEFEIHYPHCLQTQHFCSRNQINHWHILYNHKFVKTRIYSNVQLRPNIFR